MIAKQLTLINEEYLAYYSELPTNYNYNEIIPYVKTTELIWIEKLLGTPLYEELLEQVNNNTVTDVNSTLLLELYPYLCKAIVFEALPFIMYHFGEVGVTKGKSDNSESIDIKDINYINTHIRGQLEYQKTHVINWLNARKEYYPLYKPNNDNECEKNILNKPNPNYQVYTINKIDNSIK